MSTERLLHINDIIHVLVNVTFIYEGHSIKNETFFYSGMNLYARLMKSCPKLACLFGCSHITYSMCYLVPAFVARQH